MGASNSAHTRTVIIDNDSPIGVIDVSDAVVQRLKGGLTAKGCFFFFFCCYIINIE